jgi:hypothetical protein
MRWQRGAFFPYDEGATAGPSGPSRTLRNQHGDDRFRLRLSKQGKRAEERGNDLVNHVPQKNNRQL